MTVIPIGPFMIRADIAVFLIVALAGYLALRIRLHRLEHRDWLLDTYVYSLLIGFAVWKFGMLIWDPVRTLRHPLSLIYMTGGMRGIWLGSLFAGIYVLSRWNKMRSVGAVLFKSFLMAAMAGGLAYLLLGGLINDHPIGVVQLLAMLLLLVLLIYVWLKFETSLSQLLTFGLGRNGAVMLVIGSLLVWAVYNHLNESGSGSPGDRPAVTDDADVIAEGLKPGNRAPDFTLLTADGQEVRLSDYRGRTVLLNFWASWCPPCKAEMPYMEDFYKRHKEEDVVILAVNMTHLEGSMEDAASFVQSNGLTFPVSYDREGTVTGTYEVTAYPTTYVLTPDGVVSERYQGAINEELMVKAYRRASGS